MRNLKRVLSLAMATAMLLGMMVMGAGAADSTTYSDQNSIKNQEAVAVMSAIGVFQGADGKFSPNGVLTRESAAKIITYMVMGKAAADDLSTSSAPFTDVAANRWSAGSIAYCVANGIISGDGAGHFYPEMTVNGYAFAKMVLGALGYNASTEKMVGNGWESNVSKLVTKAGLKKGITAAMSKDMTREQAAQMAFNALNAQTVTYTGGIEYTNPDGSKFTMGATRELSVDENGKALSFAAQNYPDLKPSDKVENGVPSKVWKLGAKTIGTFATTADFTFTSHVGKADDLGLDSYTVKSGATVTFNGVGTAPTVTDLDELAAATGNGRKVELYVNDTDKSQIDSVVITDTRLSKITTVNTVSKIVSLDGIGNVAAKDQEALYNALVDMGKDAKVLVTATKANKVLTVAVPETVEGTYTAKDKDGNLTIGGTKYTPGINVKLTLTGGTTYTAYLDSYGYLLAAEAEAAAATSYGFLSAMERVGTGSTGYTFNVKLLMNDGTQEWVEVSTADTTAVSKIADIDAFAKLIFKAGSADEKTKGIVSYAEKSDGTYTIKPVAVGKTTTGTVTPANEDTYYDFANQNIKKATAKFFGNTSDNDAIQGSNKTIFLVENGSGSYSVYEGVKNVPNLEKASGFVLVGKKTTTASIVVVTSKTNAVDSSALVYLVSGDYGSVYDETLKQDVYTYTAIKDGEVTTLTTTVIKDGDDADLKAGMYTVSYDSNDYGVKLVEAETGDKKIVRTDKAATISNGTITLADKLGTGASVSGTYVTADEFVVIVIDTNGNAFVSSADSVQYYTEQKNAYVIMDSDQQFATTLIVDCKN